MMTPIIRTIGLYTAMCSVRVVVLLCRSGGRSARAAEFLASSGFDDVVNLDGGMLAFAATA